MSQSLYFGVGSSFSTFLREGSEPEPDDFRWPSWSPSNSSFLSISSSSSIFGFAQHGHRRTQHAQHDKFPAIHANVVNRTATEMD